jgi:FkbM family methyltransferase
MSKVNGREIVKLLVQKICTPRMQRGLRHYYVVRRVLKSEKHTEAEASLLPSLLRAGDFVADFGANFGYYTKQLSSLVGVQGRVYAFEPLSENFEILQTVVHRGQLSNVVCFRAALGAEAGLRELVVPDMKGFAGTYWAHLAQPGDQGFREYVAVLPLDDLWRRETIPRLDFVKCDVEGAELEVLKGGLQLLRTGRPVWLLEVSRRTCDQVFGLFHGLGYRSFVFDERLNETQEYREGKFSNYFFLHPQSSLWKRVLSSNDVST